MAFSIVSDAFTIILAIGVFIIIIHYSKMSKIKLNCLESQHKTDMNDLSILIEKCNSLERRLNAQQSASVFLQEELLALEWLRDNNKSLLPDRSLDPPSYSRAATKFGWSCPLKDPNGFSLIPATLKTDHR